MYANPIVDDSPIIPRYVYLLLMVILVNSTPIMEAFRKLARFLEWKIFPIFYQIFGMDPKQIDCWVIDNKVHQNSEYTVYKG